MLKAQLAGTLRRNDCPGLWTRIWIGIGAPATSVVEGSANAPRDAKNAHKKRVPDDVPSQRTSGQLAQVQQFFLSHALLHQPHTVNSSTSQNSTRSPS